MTSPGVELEIDVRITKKDEWIHSEGWDTSHEVEYDDPTLEGWYELLKDSDM